MAGTKQGGLNAARTNKERYGEDFYRIQGAKGGSKPTDKPKGFAANRELAREAGRKGGKISRRTGVKNKPVARDTRRGLIKKLARSFSG